MQVPLQITARNLSLSAVAEDTIRKKAEGLEQFCDRITRCHVVVEAPHRHQQKGVLYDVRIHITVPGTELTVRREEHEDIYVSIRDAFDAARRELQDYVRRQSGTIKHHQPAPLAQVSKLFPNEDYGFLQTADGREIYFHRRSVLQQRFDQLRVGDEVRFAEEMGEKGPQASTVSLTGK